MFSISFVNYNGLEMLISIILFPLSVQYYMHMTLLTSWLHRTQDVVSVICKENWKSVIVLPRCFKLMRLC